MVRGGTVASSPDLLSLLLLTLDTFHDPQALQTASRSLSVHLNTHNHTPPPVPPSPSSHLDPMEVDPFAIPEGLEAFLERAERELDELLEGSEQAPEQPEAGPSRLRDSILAGDGQHAPPGDEGTSSFSFSLYATLTVVSCSFDHSPTSWIIRRSETHHSTSKRRSFHRRYRHTPQHDFPRSLRPHLGAQQPPIAQARAEETETRTSSHTQTRHHRSRPLCTF